MSLTRDIGKLNIDSDGSLHNTRHVGSVGIGTTSPDRNLHVKKTDTGGTVAKFENTAGSTFIEMASSAGGGADGGYIEYNATKDLSFHPDDTRAMTIKSNGDVLVGKTASDGSTTGHELRSGSFAIHTRPSNPSLYARRMTDDGPVVIIQDQNGDVGKIGVNGGSMHVGGGDVGTAYYQVADAIVPVDAGTGALRNNAIDLGLTSARYKDVHVGNAVKTSSAQFNAAGTYTADVFTNRNDNYFEGYRSCLGFFASGAGQPYIHLKTNLPDNGNKMIKFEWNGFTYSGVNSHNSVTFYTYSGTNSPYNPIHHNWGNGHGIVNYYYSSDNYVVIVCQTSGSYTGGFLYVQSGRSHIWYNPDITTASNSSATGGVY